MKGINRFLALIMALSCLMLPLNALAAGAQDININVAWWDASGAFRVSDRAVPVTDDPEETRFWITLPADAPMEGLILQVADLGDLSVSFQPAMGDTLPAAVDALGSLEAVPVEIMAFSALGELKNVYYLYLSTLPLPDTGVSAPAQVTVRYTDEYGQPLRDAQTLSLPQGEHTVYAEEISGWEVRGEAVKTVSVDAYGAYPAEITFVYGKNMVSGEVTVHLVDESGSSLMGDQTLTFQEGVSNVIAPYLDGYTVVGQDSYSVTVDGNGVYPGEVTFTYKRPSASVTVHYVDENGQALLSDVIYKFDAGDHPINAPQIDQYTVQGLASYNVSVDAEGAHPGEITFVYGRYVAPADVVIRYLDENGASILPDARVTLEAGSHTLYAEAIDGWMLDGPEALPVNVTEEGAQPGEVVFMYTRLVLPADVTAHYVDENGVSIAPDTVQTVQPGSTQVYPAAAISPSEYLLTGASYYDVYVTADGASPSEITFTYQHTARAAVITVHYVDDQGTPIAPDTSVTVEPGIRQVTPDDIIPKDEYSLLPPESVPVTVDVNGPSMAEVTFTYQRLVQPVDVTVHYVDDRGETIYPDTVQTFGGGEHQIVPDGKVSPDDYTLTEPTFYPLTVSLEGGSVAEVTFTYRRAVKPAAVTVHYTDAQGVSVASDTQETLGEGGFVVFPHPTDLLPNYYPAADSPEFQNVTVDADGAHPAEVTFVYEYRAPAPAVIAVRYMDEENGLDVASAGQAEAPAGTVTEITAAPQDLLEDYELISEPAMYVAVDETGRPDQDEVVFLYHYAASTQEPTSEATEEPSAPPTEEPTPEPTQEPVPTAAPAPVLVQVRYVDEAGADVAAPMQIWCNPGETLITPEPADLTDDYRLEGPESVTVTVNENGAEPEEALFLYRFVGEASAPKVALVNVKYLDPQFKPFYFYTETCAEGQENKVTVDWAQVDPALGYELSSDAEVYVTVDRNGMAEPAEVIFQFRGEVEKEVTVLYRDAQTDAELAAPQKVMCYAGSNNVFARPEGLPENYALSGPDSVSVFLDEEGNLSADEVVFQYTYVAPATPTPQPLTYETPMDAYIYPNGSDVRVRSTPNTAEDNILGMVNSGDLGHVLGSLQSDGKTWYAVEIKGIQGYMSESVLRFLSEAEMAAVFGYTIAPTDLPTPAPTDVPDGAAIDRWAKTTAAVNFRRSADRSGERISEIKKNARVWVYGAQTVNGEKWYAVRANGVDGYLMADYVEVASEEESREIQAQLASPMPTQTPPVTEAPTQEPTAVPTETPVPTEEPTPEPTLEPTEAPTQEPAATETPVPYRGYALTNGQAALRTGVSQTDDTILEMLPEESLLYVQSQTHVDGVSWSFVQAVSSGNLGFMLQSSFDRISNEEALTYLDRLQTTPTPAPTETPVPEQTEGYAMTLGDGVPMRNFPDTNGEIITLLPYMAVANVRGQQYAGNAAWHLVQYNGMWGYIRQDQLRMMSREETLAYETSLAAGTPTPSPAPTPEPITQESLSSYGHVQSSSGRVNLRSGPSKSSNAIRLLDNYAFALVLGSETNEEGTWYHVSQGGNEGYILSDYFKVLPLSELSSFLQSSEYLNANSNNASSSANVSQIQPVEDYNRTVWQNPALTASYEPFNPYLTPTPDPEQLPTDTPAPTATPTPTPTPEIAPVGPQDNPVVPASTVQEGGSPWPWVLLGLAVAAGGGAYYAYTVRKQNEKRRQAMRLQQARQARSAAAQPQMRTAQNNPAQPVNRPSYPSQTAAYMPPQTGASRAPQATGVYKPQTGEAGVPTETRTYPPMGQETQTFQAPRQTTQAYRPTQQNPMSFEGISREDMEALAQDTRAFQVPAPVTNDQRLNLDIKVARLDLEEIAGQTAVTPPKPVEQMTPVEQPAPVEQMTPVEQPAPYKRVRRTERNKKLYEENQDDNTPNNA